MNRMTSTLAAALAAGLLALPAHAGGNHAHGGHGHDHGAGGHDDHGHAHEPPPHQAKARNGGVVLADGSRLFEVTIRDAGIRVHPMDAAGAPLPVAGLSGTVLLKARTGRRLSFDLKPVSGAAGMPGYLEATRDLAGVADGSRTAMFSLQGFGGDADRASVFTRFVRTHRDEAHDDHGHGHDDHGHDHGAPKAPPAPVRDDHGHDHGGHGHDH